LRVRTHSKKLPMWSLLAYNRSALPGSGVFNSSGSLASTNPRRT
jgi:hypothetical protein